jgi:hypothetical protein
MASSPPNAPPDAGATVKEDHHHRDLERSHRPLAFEGAEVDTRHRGRDDAVGGRPSTGAAPQPLQILDLSSPSTTTAAAGTSNQIQPANNHISHSLHHILEKRSQRKHHLPEMTNHRPGTPVQKLSSSPLSPERSNKG